MADGGQTKPPKKHTPEATAVSGTREPGSASKSLRFATHFAIYASKLAIDAFGSGDSGLFSAENADFLQSG